MASGVVLGGEGRFATKPVCSSERLHGAAKRGEGRPPFRSASQKMRDLRYPSGKVAGRSQL